ERKFGPNKLMARGKVQMKRIENPVHRQVTFCKRRAGLLKKAKELSVLCDAEIGLFIFSSHGKLYELATKGTMHGLVERYMKSTRPVAPPEPAKGKQVLDSIEEINMLKHEIEALQKGLGYMSGRGTGTMTLDELHVLEQTLEVSICHIRSAKVAHMDIMSQEIESLKNEVSSNYRFYHVIHILLLRIDNVKFTFSLAPRKLTTHERL
ncbi:hypothetical protein RJ639_021477, partial [Escallonia herrerae]